MFQCPTYVPTHALSTVSSVGLEHLRVREGRASAKNNNNNNKVRNTHDQNPNAPCRQPSTGLEVMTSKLRAFAGLP